MATLTGNTIASTYTGLLSVSGAVGADTVEAVTDGAGTSTSLSLSQQRATITLGSGAADDFIVDGTTLVVEGDNNRVGIGTTSPGATFHSKGYTSYAGYGYTLGIFESTDTTGQLMFVGSSGVEGGIQFSSTTFTLLAGDGNNAINILNGGNVGIGAAAPASDTGFAGPVLEIHGAEPVLHLSGTGAGTPDWELGVDVSVGADALHLRIDAEANEVMTWESGGVVGIGTSAPTAVNGQLLEIASASYGGMTLSSSSETAAAAPLLFFNKSGNATVGSHTVVTENEVLGYIQFRGSDGSAFEDAAGIRAEVDGEPFTSSDTTDMPGRLMFYTTPDGSATLAERMRIDSSGNVGVATQAPIGKLQVDDTYDDGVPGFYIAHAGQSNLYGFSMQLLNGGSTAGMDFRRHTNSVTGVSQMYFERDGGNIGIWTTNPEQILDCNSGSGNAIADGWDTHSLAVYKENIEDASGYLDKVLACPAQKWNRKPFVSADEIKEAVLEEFGEDVLIEEAVEAQDAVYQNVELSPAVEAKDAVIGERQVVIVSEVEEEVSSTEIVLEDGKYVQKTTTETVTKEVETPQYEEVTLYNEDGEEIGTHSIPEMEDYEEEPAVEAVDAVTEEELVSEAIESKDAVYEKQYSVWDELFPENNSHRQKALYNMPDGDLKTWIDDWCEAKRVEMRPEDKWQKKRLGLVADAELTAEHLPEVVSINDDGEPTGIDTMTYIGILHNAIQELSDKVTALENA